MRNSIFPSSRKKKCCNNGDIETIPFLEIEDLKFIALIVEKGNASERKRGTENQSDRQIFKDPR